MGHQSGVLDARVLSDGATLCSTSEDGTTRLWDVSSRKELCSLISYTDGSWAVVDPEGRYDSSDSGHNPNLYWVYEDPSKGVLETIDIEQFSSQFYTPGLLARVMRREALPPVPDIKNAPLFPKVEQPSAKGSTVAFGLVARGGGIGTARVFADGQEVAEVQGKEGKNEVRLPVPIKPDAKIEVVAFNRDDSLSSPRSTGTTAPPVDVRTPTRYVAVIAGVNEYQGALRRLSYAVADATAMVKAVQTLADGLKLKPEIYLLTNDVGSKGMPGVIDLPATREAFENVLTKVIPAKGAWRQSDMLFLYLAGHGTSYTQNNKNHYAYLTQTATSAEGMKDPDTRAQQAVTDDELVRWLAFYIGGKKALVLDTCAAGSAIEALQEGTRSQDEDLARQQAIYETQRRTGIRMLFGCAENLHSYESAEYGHGLLTWSLLSSLANDSLGLPDNENLVMVGNLFLNAEESVKRESKSQQRAQGYGTRENFPLGFLDETGRKAIPFTSKVPLFDSVTLVNGGAGFKDDLGLSKQIVEALTNASRGDKPAARLAPSSPRAIKVTGGYDVAGDRVKVTLNLIRGDKEIGSLEVTSGKADVVRAVVGRLLEWAKANAQ